MLSPTNLLKKSRHVSTEKIRMFSTFCTTILFLPPHEDLTPHRHRERPLVNKDNNQQHSFAHVTDRERKGKENGKEKGKGERGKGMDWTKVVVVQRNQFGQLMN